MKAILTQIRNILSNHKLASIIVAGIIIRAILIPISAHPFDVYVWYQLSSNILKNGALSLQAFPPLWYHYTMIPIAYTYEWLSRAFSIGAIPMTSLPSTLDFYPSYNIQYVPGPLFNSIVKFPFLISDILITLLLYKIVETFTKNKGLAEKAALLWFLNPFVIWISAGWGMWDTLPALFSLVAFYLLLKRKTAFSAVFLSLGVASKLYPALFLVPIAIYIFKTSDIGEKWKEITKYFSVFSVSSLLLFLPYFGMIAGFYSFFIPNPATTAIVTDPVVDPLGFGLTYWSVYLLNRLFKLPVTAEFISIASLFSVILVAACLILTYWKISKLTFQKPTVDLALVMLLPLLALFLSYRFICEQWLVWILPFLIILCVVGRVKWKFYWGVSAVALLYVFLNCPLPFFFLPLAPWLENSLLGMVYAFWAVEPLRIILLALLGCVFSIILFLVLLKLVKFNFPPTKSSSQ
jgi:hypothetical protein